ncbi:manganese efflux pump MntP [Alicyclobacillus mengziensis]|uniref:Manganese efflux pump n=1 Tax=Alicyclobacillus mengziensis TaxID=2931921 RepID=A0A9X7VVX4_9BACL|nr:manganese efflux pump [Alicyclobacillus mengziensis]QSO46078.1 manganese efflux pump [Alicyclobacillus mengziensis]
MNWLSAFITANLIGIGSNFDNCGTGIAYGSDKIKFPHWVNAIVNAIGFSTAILGAYAGKATSDFLTVSQAQWAACVVLVCIGLFFWYGGYIHPLVSKHKQKIQTKTPGWKEGVILGLALSFTNVASGFGATVANATTLWSSVISITLWGYIMIWLGNTVGIGVIARLLGKYSSLAAGLMLILVGVHQVMG